MKPLDILFLGAQASKLNHYTVIVVKIFAMVHVYIQYTASVTLGLYIVQKAMLLLRNFITYRELGDIWSGKYPVVMIDSLASLIQ